MYVHTIHRISNWSPNVNIMFVTLCGNRYFIVQVTWLSMQAMTLLGYRVLYVTMYAQTYSCQNVEHLLNDNCATKTGCDHGPSFHAMMNIRTYVHSIYNSTVTY